jgi:hypothetical protein
MFCGEMLCLFYYFLKIQWVKRKKMQNTIASPEEDQIAEQVNLKKKVNPLLLSIPAILDLISSNLLMVALT